MRSSWLKLGLWVLLVILVIASLVLLGVIAVYRRSGEIPNCSYYLKETGETVDCDYELELPNGQVKRLVRVVGVERENDNGFVVVQRRREGAWIKEKIFMGKSGDDTLRAILYTNEPYLFDEGEVTDEILTPDQMYEAVSARIGKEAFVFAFENRKQSIGGRDYLSLNQITFFEK